MRGPIYKSTFKVEIFSEGPLPPDMYELDELNEMITEGDCIGSVEFVREDRVPVRRVRRELVEIGNDGTFFDDV